MRVILLATAQQYGIIIVQIQSGSMTSLCQLKFSRRKRHPSSKDIKGIAFIIAKVQPTRMMVNYFTLLVADPTSFGIWCFVEMS